ncbi:TolC family protein [Seonamhaeicola sediminis]|uniref:TolC family protein n=1 Tax=Seonamhaeicola sediminis TaxID=2528206 RepID=A0A562YE95_9FLAO|nr:TolC family protein [Seonamhaeicola sediminis]TWO32614.1 TolC family protein [Seonamhaeicola sediminis]
MKKIIIFLTMSFIGSSMLIAQEVVFITKADVLSKVSDSNLSIKISNEDFNQAKADFRQSNAVFLPSITASHTGMATTNPLMAFGSKLNQEILTQNDFNPALLNDPSQIENFATRLEIKQPLINIDGFYQRKAAKSKMEAMFFKKERTAEYLELEVEKAYMQLQLAYRGVEVLEKALEAAMANKKLADDRFNQGYLQRADVLNIEVRVTEVKNQLQTAKSNVKNASNYLSFLMNDDAYTIYKPTDSLLVFGVSTINKRVSENRSDIKAMGLVSEAYQANYKADKMAFLPRLNAFGSYELYDDEIFQADAKGYLFGAQLSWDIFQGSKRIAKSQKSRAEFEKSKLEYSQYVSQSNLELNKANRMLTDAQNKLDLTALALKQSEESLRIFTNRFKEGLEKTSDLLMAETKYAQKQLEYYQIIFEYNYAHAYLKFLTKE